MLLYHGSDHIVGMPIYGKGKLHNDYGRGFYCTEEIALAKEWAVTDSRDGFVNCYRLDVTDDIFVLDLNAEKYTVLHWLGVLLQNRTFDLTTPMEREAKRYITEYFHVPIEEADLVLGYRADDSYFSYARDFIGGVISYEQLSCALRLGDLGEQVCIKSKKAFDLLCECGCEKVSSAEWYPKKMLRDTNARAGYRSMDRENYHKGQLYMARILDEELRADDLRLR